MATSHQTASSTCNRRLFRLALQHRRYVALIGATSLLGAIAVIAQMTSLGGIIDGAFLGSLDLTQLTMPFVWLGAAVCLRAAGVCSGGLAAQTLAIRIKEELSTRLFRRLIDLGPLFTQQEKTGELVASSVEGIEKLDPWYVSFLPHALAMGIVPITLAIFVTWIDWPSGLVLMLTGPLIPIFMALIGISAKQKIDRQWSALQRMSGHFLDVLQGLPTLHLLGRSDLQAANILKVSEEFRRKTMQVLYIAFLSGMVLELAASISTAVVAVEIGIRLIEGLIRFQTGLIVLLLAPEFYLPFRLFGASHHAGMEGSAAGQRIFAILDLENAGNAGNRNHPSVRETSGLRVCVTGHPMGAMGIVTGDPGAARLSIRFQGVDYQYPGASFPALCGVTFELFPGRIHLLTGHSGAGKSTVMKLLLQLLQPTHGLVLANGRPLTEIPPEVWRSHIAFVPQHPHFFEGSVLDNLRLANRDVSLDEVRAAARLAEADAFILALPEGYYTPISEAARRFSGGERQRLAIARALLKNSPLFLLDEPVSHLDAVTAAKLQRILFRLAPQRTTLIVAHHGFAFSEVDEILVLSQGQLLPDGREGFNPQEAPEMITV
jgi:thiol reductant ABC exporter CydD subunit